MPMPADTGGIHGSKAEEEGPALPGGTAKPGAKVTVSRAAFLIGALALVSTAAAERAEPVSADAGGSPRRSPAPGSTQWEQWDNILNPDHLPAFYDHFEQIEAAKPAHHWVMVIDLRKCIGCQSCTVACKSENGVPVGSFRTWVDVSQIGRTVPARGGETVTESGTYQQQIKVLNVPKLCNHCDNPPCVEVCPVKATFKRADGPVLVDPRLCIGCGTCVNACPYGARYINPISHTADKCTLCVERIDRGLLPACVTSCVGHARIFGDLNDPTSEVSQLISRHQVQVRKPELGTDPQVFYVGLDGTLGVLDDPAIQHLVYTYAMNTNSTAYRQLGGTPALAETALARE